MKHVTIDLYGCKRGLLTDEQYLRQILDQLPDRIGMRKAGPVSLRFIHTGTPLDDGYSGFVIIFTSHVSLHAWGAYDMVNIDVFSCEEFDEADVQDFACGAFGTADVEMHVLTRATRSPRPLRSG